MLSIVLGIISFLLSLLLSLSSEKWCSNKGSLSLFDSKGNKINSVDLDFEPIRLFIIDNQYYIGGRRCTESYDYLDVIVQVIIEPTLTYDKKIETKSKNKQYLKYFIYSLPYLN